MTKSINQLLDWQQNSALATLPQVSSEEQRTAMRHYASGVSIITSHDEPVRAGLTATAVCSVTADPPRLVVFVNKNVLASQAIRNSGALCVNVLAGDQEEVAKAFAGMIKDVHGEDRFQYGTWEKLLTGSPVLSDALINFDCRVIKVYDESTHHAFLCEVLATHVQRDHEALIYLNGAFQRVAC